MVDSAYITENCILVSDLHRETSSTVAEATRSTLAKPLKVLLPKDAIDSPLQQTVNLVNLSHQLLQVAVKQADDSQMLADMAACIGRAFNADGCAIILSDETTAKVRATGWFADAPLLPLQPLEVASDYFGNWLAETALIPCNGIEAVRSRPVTAPSASKTCKVWQSIKQLRTSLPPVRAIASATMHLPDHVHGVISLMRSRTQTWNQSEIAGLQTVSHQVASIFDQLQLQQQFHKQMQYQRVVNQLTLAIHNASDLNDILKLATDDTASALQVKRGMLLRLKHWDALFRNHAQVEQPKVRVNVAYEWLSDTPFEATYPLQASTAASPSALPTAINQSFWLSECTLCQQAFLHPRSPFILSSNSAAPLDAVTFDAEGEAAAAFDLKSLPALLMMPLESQGTILGFLVFQHDQPRVWQPAELELVQLVGAQVSTAIIQAETLRQVQSLVEKRTAELRASLAVQAKLYDRTRHQLDQLRQLNQARDEFLSTVSHELRTPLTSMTLAIRMLRQMGLSAERSACYLDILEQQCAQETSLINDLLGLQELESNQIAMSPQEIDLKALIHDLTRLFQQKWSAKGLTLEVKLPRRSLRLLSDRNSLHRILFELLTNAGKYADQNSCVQLHVALKAESAKHQSAINQIIVTLRNIGQGIAPDELPLIFDKFKRSQIATQKAVQGTGLGLALVKSLVLHLNGDISASSHRIDDTHTFATCFTLTLPQTL
ncbi:MULTISPECIES: GAF domain-containing sensor histidine kinase [Cyanophyceae]|nr:GAF domain-containing sensor histidine kinase [Phormidium sp. FACHB-592]